MRSNFSCGLNVFLVVHVLRWVGAPPEITTPSSGLPCLRSLNQEVPCTGPWCFKVNTHTLHTYTNVHAHTLSQNIPKSLLHFTACIKTTIFLFNKGGTNRKTAAWDLGTTRTRSCSLIAAVWGPGNWFYWVLERSDVIQHELSALATVCWQSVKLVGCRHVPGRFRAQGLALMTCCSELYYSVASGCRNDQARQKYQVLGQELCHRKTGCGYKIQMSLLFCCINEMYYLLLLNVYLITFLKES